MRTRILSVIALLGLAAWMVGCENQAQTNAVAGGVVGALAGQAIGHNTEGTLIGAGVGAGAGYMIGNEADKAQMNRQIQADREMANTLVINIHNDNGSITPVPLRRMANVWVGPNGEQYFNIPSEDQLRAMYGNGTSAPTGLQPPPIPVEEAPPSAVVVPQGPPAVIVERRPFRPATTYVWVDGYWVWNGANYAWRPGYWTVPPQPYVVWSPPVYTRFEFGYHYRRGYWRHR